MQFRDLIGQTQQVQRLVAEVAKGRIPHARLFVGKAGTGALPLALAYASYLLCPNKHQGDSCGKCPTCLQTRQLVHPDLHFAFPVIKSALSDRYLQEWREIVAENPYFDMPMWEAKLGLENQQPLIYTAESDSILHKLSLKAMQDGYKIMIIWMPERMNEQGANKLLKLIEEPPRGTVFLLVAQDANLILPTITSRTQGVYLPPLPTVVIEAALQQHYALSPADAYKVAHLAQGSWLKAVQHLHVNDEEKRYYELFVSLMRLAYQRKVQEMYKWSEQVAQLGRERQKHFLDYAQHMVRENFMHHFKEPRLCYMNKDEAAFSQKFSPFINERNVTSIMQELDSASRDIEQNVNARMVFFDFALQMIVLLLK